MTAIYIEIIATKGSAPRDAGTAMKVTPDALFGTIGGGALEHQAIAHARFMLATDAPETRQTIPLGPGLGQCCGGSVRLLFTRQARPVDADVFIAAYCLPATYPMHANWIAPATQECELILRWEEFMSIQLDAVWLLQASVNCNICSGDQRRWWPPHRHSSDMGRPTVGHRLWSTWNTNLEHYH